MSIGEPRPKSRKAAGSRDGIRRPRKRFLVDAVASTGTSRHSDPVTNRVVVARLGGGVRTRCAARDPNVALGDDGEVADDRVVNGTTSNDAVCLLYTSSAAEGRGERSRGDAQVPLDVGAQLGLIHRSKLLPGHRAVRLDEKRHREGDQAERCLLYTSRCV